MKMHLANAAPIALAAVIALCCAFLGVAWLSRRRRPANDTPAFAQALESVSELVTATSREKIAENLLDLVTRSLDVPRAALFIPSKGGGAGGPTLVPLGQRGLPPAEAEACVIDPAGDSVIAMAHRERKAISVPAAAPTATPTAPAPAQERGPRSTRTGPIDPRAKSSGAGAAPDEISGGVMGLTVGLPLIVHGDVFGILGIAAPGWDSWPARRRDMMLKSASLACAALGKITRFEQASAQTDEERRKVDEVTGLLSASVSPSIAKQLLTDPKGVSFEGQVREITVLFSDIWDFTTFSETTEPRLVIKRLNAYLSAMTEVILEHDGTVDKYVGDQIMAYWNAPVMQDDHAWRAVQATLGMRRKLRELRMQAVQEGRDPFRMGIALNTGRAVFGYIGSQLKRDITIIGDAVNLGARLEKLTREHGTDIVLGSATYQLVKAQVEAQLLGKVKVKGREEEESVYQLIGLKAKESSPAAGAALV